MKQNRFDFFKEGLSDIINKDNDENTGSGCIEGGGGGGDDDHRRQTYWLETL